MRIAPRTLICLAALALAATGTARAAGAPAAAAPAPAKDPYSDSFDVQKIADGVYALIRNYPAGLMVDGNSVFIVNEDDVVVVDAPEASSDMLAALRKITDKPVKYVINTHWHDDHITGNHVYREAFPAVQFIAHRAFLDYLPTTGLANRKGMIEGAPGFAADERKALAENRSLAGGEITPDERAGYASDVRLVDRYMAEVPKAEILLPDIAVEDRLTLRRGSRTIEILHLPGHTAGDLVVRLPKENVVVTGDLVVWPVPLIGNPQSHIRDWAVSLASLRAFRGAIYVPGHGPVLRDDAYLALMEELMHFVVKQAEAAVARGDTLDAARKAVDWTDLKKRFAGDSRMRAILFASYVKGPALEAAFGEASPKKADGKDHP